MEHVDRVKLEQKAQSILLTKRGQFSFAEALESFMKLCGTELYRGYAQEIMIEALDYCLNQGYVKFEKGKYYSTYAIQSESENC